MMLNVLYVVALSTTTYAPTLPGAQLVDEVGSTVVAKPAPVSCAAFSPDGKWLVVGSNAGTVETLNLATGTWAEKSLQHNDKVTSVAFRPDGKQFATSSYDGRVKVWHVDEHAFSLHAVLTPLSDPAFMDPGGKLQQFDKVIYSADPTIITYRTYETSDRLRLPRLYSSRIGEGLPVFQNHAFGKPTTVASHPASPYVLAIGTDTGEVTQWKLDQEKEFAAIREGGWGFGTHGSITALEHSPNGQFLAWTNDNPHQTFITVRLTHKVSGTNWYEYECKKTHCLAVTNEGYIWTGHGDGIIRFWTPRGDENRMIPTRLLEAHEAPVRHMVFSGPAACLASADEKGKVCVWDATTHRLLRTLEHSHSVTSLAFSPDGKLLVSGCLSEDGTNGLLRVDSVPALLKKGEE